VIIIVFGLPGSGKSYFATNLAGMIKAVYINSDQVRRNLFAVRKYSTREKLSVYNEMLIRMSKAVQQHKNVVLDATFYTNDIRKKFLDAAEDIDNIIFIEVRAQESLTKERLKRPRKDSEANFDVYKKIKRQWEPLNIDHLVLQSTDDNITDMLEKTAAYLHIKE
jgi:predicted kinase